MRARNNESGDCGANLLAVEAATYSVDIGAGNEKVVERRYQSTFTVNVAEF